MTSFMLVVVMIGLLVGVLGDDTNFYYDPDYSYDPEYSYDDYHYDHYDYDDYDYDDYDNGDYDDDYPHGYQPNFSVSIDNAGTSTTN